MHLVLHATSIKQFDCSAWHTPVILAQRGKKQLWASLVYKAKSCLKNKTNQSLDLRGCSRYLGAECSMNRSFIPLILKSVSKKNENIHPAYQSALTKVIPVFWFQMKIKGHCIQLSSKKTKGTGRHLSRCQKRKIQARMPIYKILFLVLHRYNSTQVHVHDFFGAPAYKVLQWRA